MPHTILQTATLRELEQQHANAVPPLMQRAGAAAADYLNRLLRCPARRVAVVVGPGNNGGDARAMLPGLRAAGQQVVILDAQQPPNPTMARRWDAIVDGVLGIGLARAPQGTLAAWIDWINAAHAPIKLALDVPSGLIANTGQVLSPCVRATHTISFLGLKPGLLMAEGPDHAGQVHSVDLGLPLQGPSAGQPIDIASILALQQPRPRDSHKGCFGHVGVVGGAEGLEGAAILCADAALHMGPGKVSASLLSALPGAAWWRPEIMWRTRASIALAGITTWVVGPGMGESEVARGWLHELVDEQATLVLDADALNLLARDAVLWQALPKRPALTVITPHPAEAARLLGVSVASVQADRLAAARELAQRTRAWVVLKGCGTVVQAPSGDWWINDSGSPLLATGGTGDVLAGMLAGLLAIYPQHVSQAITGAVWLHGAAAQAMGLRGGLRASELAPTARRLLHA